MHDLYRNMRNRSKGKRERHLLAMPSRYSLLIDVKASGATIGIH